MDVARSLQTDELTIEEILQQIEQEETLKEMMQQSTDELKVTVKQMEDKLESVEEEGNEWKTRCENQVEINNRLNWQVNGLL